MNDTTKLRTRFVVAVALALVCISSGAAMAANKLIVKNSAGTVDKFVVTDSGLIGVGNSAPTAALDAQGIGSDAQIKLLLTGTTASYSPGMFFLRVNPNGTSSMPISGDRLGFFGFGGINGTSAVSSSAVLAYAGANWSTTSTPSFYTFETTPIGSTTRSERMRITSSGNIGIGATSPTQKLEVNGGLRLNTSTTKPACDSTNGPTNRGTIWFARGGTGVADTLEVCVKRADENYEWKPLF